jgi:nodulation protein E
MNTTVVITGMGAVSALGVGATVLWEGLRDGRSGIAPLVHPRSVDLHTTIAAQAHDFHPADHFDERSLNQLDRVSQFALVAAGEAVNQSGLVFDECTAARTAVVIGTGVGGELSHDEQDRRLYAENARRLHPLAIIRSMASASASQISVAHRLTGPAFVVSSACASANHAIAQAVMMIRSGIVDVAVTGGSEACLSYGLIKAWEAMRVLAGDTCRPFARGRQGLVLGEGAGVFVIESLEHARARGAAVLASIAGIGMSADAADIVAPSDIGAARAISTAMQDAGLNAGDIQYINAHGTGTQANDITETRAIRLALGPWADGPLVSSTKSMHGHALGASGALELVAVVGAIRNGVVPPTMNFCDRDPECDLSLVVNESRQHRVHAALSHSFAFGGLNAVLAVTSNALKIHS